MIARKNWPSGKIVMIGDSITDSGRKSDPEELGSGYVRMLRDFFLLDRTESELVFCNKGVSGNRVTDLAARWEEDVIDEQPDFLSISIGINDVWRQLDQPSKKQVLLDEFADVYGQLLKDAQSKTGARLILMEPTVIEEDLSSEGNQKLVPYINTVRALSAAYNAILVPSHQTFTHFISQRKGVPLTTDGVHMTSLGNMLLAHTWIEAVSDALK
ncbi:SGNH/GDSL hydrolase family protein [Bacillus sp. FJAT-42376]|uniref:SGNH/GDSL hydrolase family protein n=1 Tax=Bacillus sp. FJAT-42376 TaxID=2014076 RepID=UPI001F151174|nr:SGNH/GDSL hydrolase family protein [Bacillus sp. FJAT-42376]